MTHQLFSAARPIPCGSSHDCAPQKTRARSSLKQESWSRRSASAAAAAAAAAECVTAPLLAAALLLAGPPAVLGLAAAPPAFAQPISNGAALFQKACIGCHDMGGNILQPGATLFMKDLERNGVATEEGIYDITYYGKGRMPGFGERCTPRGQCTFGPRLQDDDIKLLAEFVKSQAENGWPKFASHGD